MTKLPMLFTDHAMGVAYKGYYVDGGDKVVLYMPKVNSRDAFFRLLAEVKGLEGATWLSDQPEKPWSCKHPRFSRRNTHALGLLTGGNFPGTVKRPFGHIHDAGQQAARLLANIEQDPVWERITRDLPGRHGFSLKKHQLEDATYTLFARTVELAHHMGLGKCLTAMCVMDYIKEHMTFSEGSTHSQLDVDNYWVIGPLSALKAWESELRKWTPSVRPKLISNSPQAIRRAMNEAPHPPFVLVNDEAANLKSGTTQRVKLTLELTDLMANYWRYAEVERHYVINMTGTPQPKDPSDWWSQVEIITPGFIRERSGPELKKRMAHMSESKQGAHGMYREVVGWNTKEIDALYRRLKPIVLIRRKEDCVDLPEKIYIKHKIEPTAELRAAERLIMKTSATTIEALTKIRQLSDGFQYEHTDVLRTDQHGNESAKRVRTGAQRIDSPKDQVVLDILSEMALNEQNRVVIWAAYHEAVDRIVALCRNNGWGVIKVDGRGWHGLSDNNDAGNGEQWTPIWRKPPVATQDQFQIEDLDKPLAFVANPESGGEGLTLTKASTAIYYSNTFKADKRNQSEDRIHRIGMDANISPRIIDIFHLSTDEWVYNNLRRKINLEKLSLGQMITEYERTELEMSS